MKTVYESLLSKSLFEKPPGGRLSPQILSIATVTPPNAYDIDAICAQSQTWVQHQEQGFQAKVDRIFRNAQVDTRYLTMPLTHLLSPMTLEERNAVYRRHIVDYAEAALKQALAMAELAPTDIDCLVTTSCTGHMSPSLEAFLANRLSMKPSMQRLPVTEMGCIGGAAGLMYAENYLRAYPGRYAALISAELSSVTFQQDDFSWSNVISTAIFGDGVACAILGSPDPNASAHLDAGSKPRILGSRMYHFPDTTDLLGFDLSNTGLRMVLDERLPECIRQHFDDFTQPLLHDFGLTLADIDHFIVHPGGKKILHNISRILKPLGKTIDDSLEILRRYGNVSSATILFILERFLNKCISPGEKALIIAFGPGLTAGTLLLEWV